LRLRAPGAAALYGLGYAGPPSSARRISAEGDDR